ncbi:hypothetical protein VPH35_052858 [Triticum aestivum]
MAFPYTPVLHRAAHPSSPLPRVHHRPWPRWIHYFLLSPAPAHRSPRKPPPLPTPLRRPDLPPRGHVTTPDHIPPHGGAPTPALASPPDHLPGSHPVAATSSLPSGPRSAPPSSRGHHPPAAAPNPASSSIRRTSHLSVLPWRAPPPPVAVAISTAPETFGSRQPRPSLP